MRRLISWQKCFTFLLDCVWLFLVGTERGGFYKRSSSTLHWDDLLAFVSGHVCMWVFSKLIYDVAVSVLSHVVKLRVNWVVVLW
ncbi:hypothetical protein GQ457_12G021610 [Hibiscus cannabinus]